MTTKNIDLPINPHLLVGVIGKNSWDEWLSETKSKLKELGYRRYVQNHKKEDFCYWKEFKNGDEKTYQIGILFYDFRKYADNDPYAHRIGIMYECMLLGDDRIDMSVSKDIDLLEFEKMAKTFYETMSQYYEKK